MIIIFIFGSKIIHMNGDNIRVLMESKHSKYYNTFYITYFGICFVPFCPSHSIQLDFPGMCYL